MSGSPGFELKIEIPCTVRAQSRKANKMTNKQFRFILNEGAEYSEGCDARKALEKVTGNKIESNKVHCRCFGKKAGHSSSKSRSLSESLLLCFKMFCSFAGKVQKPKKRKIRKCLDTNWVVGGADGGDVQLNRCRLDVPAF